MFVGIVLSSEEDLYRGEDEIIQENIKKMELLSQVARESFFFISV